MGLVDVLMACIGLYLEGGIPLEVLRACNIATRSSREVEGYSSVSGTKGLEDGQGGERMITKGLFLS